MVKTEPKKKVRLRVVERPSPVEVKPKEVVQEPSLTEDGSTELKTLPKIRLKVEEEASKAAQFATAQGLSMHLKAVKVKRAGLTALHKLTSWLTPKSKK